MVALAPVIMAVAAAVAQMLARTRQGHWAEMVAKDARTAFLALPRFTAAAAEAAATATRTPYRALTREKAERRAVLQEVRMALVLVEAAAAPTKAASAVVAAGEAPVR